MKRQLFNFIKVAPLLVPMVVFAQNNFDDDVNAELDKLYNKPAASARAQAQAPAIQSEDIQNRPTQQVQVNVAQAQPQVQPQQLQQAYPQASQAVVVPVQAQAQKQPTTFVEATPLTESKAEQMRKVRQDTEMQTEQKIVEKLEQSRIDDERRRAEVLFGDKFTQLNGQQKDQQQQAAPVAAPIAEAPAAAPQPQVVVIQQPAPAPAAPAPVAAAPAPAPSEERMDREVVRDEVNAALADLQPKKEEKKSDILFGVSAGIDNYSAQNVRGNYALGVSLAKRYSNRVVLEGDFNYANFSIAEVNSPVYLNYYTGSMYPTVTNMDQYQGSGLLKYEFSSGMFRPAVGAALAYSYRTYSQNSFALSNSTANSNAVDAGVMAGFDIDVADGISIGLDARYMFNVFNRNDNQFQQYLQPYAGLSTPIEQLSYYTFAVVAKAAF